MTIIDPALDDNSYERHHPLVTVRWTCPECKRRIVSRYRWAGQPADGDEASLFCEACELTYAMRFDIKTGLWEDAR